MPKYSVLVNRIVKIRIDNVEAESQTDAIANVQEERYGDSLLRRDGDAAKPALLFGTGESVRYMEVADDPDNAGFLVDEEDDPEYEKSTWYAADGITANNPPAGATTCDLCAGDIVSAEKVRDRKAALALGKKALAELQGLEDIGNLELALHEMVKAFGPGGE